MAISLKSSCLNAEPTSTEPRSFARFKKVIAVGVNLFFAASIAFLSFDIGMLWLETSLNRAPTGTMVLLGILPVFVSSTVTNGFGFFKT